MNALSADPTPSRVTVEEVRHIADLSNLRLTPAEEISMQRDLSAILSYVDELKELNTSAVEPMSQVGELLAVNAQRNTEDSSSSLRADESKPSLQRARVTAGAPETDGVFFKVPKVIER